MKGRRWKQRKAPLPRKRGQGALPHSQHGRTAAQKELSGPHRGQALEGPRRPSQALAGPSRGPSSAFYAGRRPSQALPPRTVRPCARFCFAAAERPVKTPASCLPLARTADRENGLPCFAARLLPQWGAALAWADKFACPLGEVLRLDSGLAGTGQLWPISRRSSSRRIRVCATA